MSFLDKIGFTRLKEGLNRTKDDLFGKINRLVNAKKKIDEEFLNELEEIFLSSDIGYDTVETLIVNIKERAKEDKYESDEELNTLIKNEVRKIFAVSTSSFSSFGFELTKKPFVIMVVGVNGVGKTTSIGKLAYNFRKAGKSVLKIGRAHV